MTLINQSFKNELLDCSITCYLKNDQIWFKGKDVATILEYKQPSKAVWDHVDSDDKIPFKDFQNGNPSPNSLDPQTIMINESGLYALIFGSKMEKAKLFKKWVTSEVLPTIRKTGKYELRPASITRRLTFRIENEHDLQCRVVSFIRTYYPDALFSSNQGELQDTPAKRIDAKCMGYLAGSPDLEIKECSKGFIGMAIEFKSPTGYGQLSGAQTEVHQKLKERGYRVIVSNDYEYVLLEIKNYLDNIRYLCAYCKKRVQLFRTIQTRKKHYQLFHKIDLED